MLSSNPFFRGFVSGLGLVHLLVGVKDIIAISQQRKEEPRG
jgi:hypothetical protein